MEFKIENYNIYNLQEGSKYSICPICSHDRKKHRQKCALLDWKTGIGTCQHCGEKFQLHSYSKKQDNITYKPDYVPPTKTKEASISTLPQNLLDATLKAYNKNHFHTILEDVFGDKKAKELMLMYNIGTSKLWSGANIFWQKDVFGLIRTGKIMLYDPITKKRIKVSNNKTNWVHKVMKLQDFNLSQCLFGENLTNSYKPIALVESEKTAVIACGYLSNFTWIATGGMQNFTAQRLKNLSNRSITVFPDLDGIEKWKEKAAKISEKNNIEFLFDTYLEKNATVEDYANKLDIADYLLRYPYEEDISSQERISRCLQQINPVLTTLIEKLDLVLID